MTQVLTYTAPVQGPVLSTEQLVTEFCMPRDDEFTEEQVIVLMEHFANRLPWDKLRKVAEIVNRVVLEDFAFAEYLMYK